MKVVLLTQEDPFYLPQNINYLLKNMPENIEVVGSVVFKASPFGKKLSFSDKIYNTISIFGWNFFFHYAVRYVINKAKPSNNIKSIFNKNKIPIIEINENINSTNSLYRINAYKPDLLISIAANQIFKQPLIDLAPKGCINLHTALLPKYRGLMPSFWVLKNNEKETGVSVFFVDEGIDSGPIIVQKKIEIGTMSQADLIKRTKRLGMDAIIEAVEKIHQGNYNLIPNNDEEMTYYSFPTREDVKDFYKSGKRFY